MKTIKAKQGVGMSYKEKQDLLCKAKLNKKVVKPLVGTLVAASIVVPVIYRKLHK